MAAARGGRPARLARAGQRGQIIVRAPGFVRAGRPRSQGLPATAGSSEGSNGSGPPRPSSGRGRVVLCEGEKGRASGGALLEASPVANRSPGHAVAGALESEVEEPVGAYQRVSVAALEVYQGK